MVAEEAFQLVPGRLRTGCRAGRSRPYKWPLPAGCGPPPNRGSPHVGRGVARLAQAFEVSIARSEYPRSRSPWTNRSAELRPGRGLVGRRLARGKAGPPGRGPGPGPSRAAAQHAECPEVGRRWGAEGRPHSPSTVIRPVAPRKGKARPPGQLPRSGVRMGLRRASEGRPTRPSPDPCRPPASAHTMGRNPAEATPLSRYFKYKTADDLGATPRRGAWPSAWPTTSPRSPCPIEVGGRRVGNRLAIQPMEGCDGDARRLARRADLPPLRRFGAGGAQADLGRGRRRRPRGPRQPPAARHRRRARRRPRPPGRRPAARRTARPGATTTTSSSACNSPTPAATASPGRSSPSTTRCSTPGPSSTRPPAPRPGPTPRCISDDDLDRLQDRYVRGRGASPIRAGSTSSTSSSATATC